MIRRFIVFNNSVYLHYMSIIIGHRLLEMMPIEHIRSKIEGELFDYTQLMFALSHYSKPRDAVSSLLKRGQIIRVRKGLYIFGTIWRRHIAAPEMLANVIYGPSAISLEYCLSWHGLIPERVNTITSVTTGRSHDFYTPAGNFSYTHLSDNWFSVGLIQHKTPSGNFIIAEPLKALTDKVWTDKRFKPTSVASYSDYIFKDLRIDENVLETLLKYDRMVVIEKAYSARKVSWLMEYLTKHFKFK